MADYDIIGALKNIENNLLDSMIRNFKHHRAKETAEGYNWTAWQIEQLNALREYSKRNRLEYPGQFEEINQKLDELIETTALEGEAAVENQILSALRQGATYTKAVANTVQGEFFKLNDRKLNSLIEATHADFVKAEYAVLRRADDIYRRTIFNAQVYANTGAGTYAQAVDMAVRDFMRAGLNCVEYKNGARHTLSDYAEMAIRTANKRANLMGEGNKRAEWGITTVVVNHRYGACNLCAPYVGKVFIDDVYSGGQRSDGDYPLLSTAIDNGLFHPNCKDGLSTWFEGISRVKAVTPEEEAEMNRREKLEQQKNYYYNQAEKNSRISEYSLDEDNKKTYEHRAKVNQQNAERIAKHLDLMNNPFVDFMGKPKREVIHLGENSFSFKTYQLSENEFIWSQTYSKNAQAMAKYITSKLNNSEFGTVRRVVIAKNATLRGVSAYNYSNDVLYISEELIDDKLFFKIVDQEYHVARSLDDVLAHELLGHKKHWEAVKKYYNMNKESFSDLLSAKKSFEKKLIEYIDRQISSDYNYIKHIISENASVQYELNNINELIADIAVLRSQNKITDKYLFEIIEELIGLC